MTSQPAAAAAAPAPTANPAPPPTRFELELEFVGLLAHPGHLQHLAATKALQDPRLVAYLRYLWAHWRRPAYSGYLRHPGPALRALELLQEPRFRAEVLRPEVLGAWAEGLIGGAGGVEGAR